MAAPPAPEKQRAPWDTPELLEVGKGVTWREASFQSDDITIVYYYTEPESVLPKLVYIHGRGSAGATSLLPFAGFADAFHVFVPDGRGRGKTQPCPHGSFTMPRLIQDAIAAIKHVSPGEPVYLIGHSMGASIAARLAKEHPELVAGLVLEDPPWRQFPGETAPLTGLPPGGGPFRKARAVQNLSEEEFLQEEEKQGGHRLPEPSKTPVWAMRVMDVDPIEYAFTEEGIEVKISEAVEGITVPVLIMRASHLYPKVAEKVLETYAEGEEIYFPGEGLHTIHSPPNLRKWLQDVKAFFARVKASRSEGGRK